MTDLLHFILLTLALALLVLILANRADHGGAARRLLGGERVRVSRRKLAQVAIAGPMTRVTAPIASATNLKQLGDLAASVRLTLKEADITTLDAASA